MYVMTSAIDIDSSPRECRIVVHLPDDGLAHVLERCDAERLLLELVLELFDEEAVSERGGTPERTSPGPVLVIPPAVRSRFMPPRA